MSTYGDIATWIAAIGSLIVGILTCIILYKQVKVQKIANILLVREDYQKNYSSLINILNEVIRNGVVSPELRTSMHDVVIDARMKLNQDIINQVEDLLTNINEIVALKASSDTKWSEKLNDFINKIYPIEFQIRLRELYRKYTTLELILYAK